MQQEKKQCKSCKQDFIIEVEDFNFYEKMKVPAPTFCPECRFIRRLASTNERVLYKRKCDLTGKEIFSMFDDGVPFPVYETDAWYSDQWDPYLYGMDYDFSRPFFEQFLELQNKVPRMALVRQGLAGNSPYVHRVSDPKNSYMVFRATSPENSMYSYISTNMRDSSDCNLVVDCELCYELVNCQYCYNVRFSQESSSCRDSSFLYACRNCSNCVGCVNLVNKEYHIFNQPYSKEEYFEKLKELKLNTASGIAKMEKEFEEFKKKLPQRAIVSVKSENVSGNWFLNCKNVQHSYKCENVKDGKYLFAIFDSEDVMDFFEWGNKAELVYESENCGLQVSRLSFCSQCWTGAHDLTYCDSCPGSGNCFGCIGLKKGEYAILNKKYSKEEYMAMIPKIIEHMNAMPYVDKLGREYRFGEHFPSELATSAYNESASIDFYPISKIECYDISNIQGKRGIILPLLTVPTCRKLSKKLLMRFSHKLLNVLRKTNRILRVRIGLRPRSCNFTGR
ncbi:MAG: hypothetical protein Q7S10_03200 [bacterium]|nr:hypothetical protein [bacterium]